VAAIRLIAVGERMPAWVDAGVADYTRRLPRGWTLAVEEVDRPRRARQDSPSQRQAHEGERLLARCPQDAMIVALDPRGEPWTTRQLADHLASWRQAYAGVALLVGGPDGLSRACLEASHRHWSLSPLTLPHGLVRVIVAEQMYRAWSLLHHHPYHR